MDDAKKCYTIAELAEITSAEIVGDPNYKISGVDDLEGATAKDASFLANPLYSKALKKSNAGVVFINQPLDKKNLNQLIHPQPSKAFQQIIELFNQHKQKLSGFVGIHPSAIIHSSAKIAPSVTIGPYVTIDKDVKIGEGSVISSHVSIGVGTTIGEHCTIHPQASIRENCQLGNGVIIQQGAVIGSCGFGYTTNAQGQHKKLMHTGRVIIEDHVEIGANTCIDRARFKDTRIRAGVKVDNLVQIAHGVEIGQGSLIISQTGIAGSTKLGRYNILAGQVGIVGHIETSDHVVLAARAAATKSITKPGRYGGTPAVPQEQFYKQQMHIRRLDTYVKRIKELESKITELEKTLQQTQS